MTSDVRKESVHRSGVKRGPRLFVDALCPHGIEILHQQIELSQENTHYLRDVLRLKDGDHLELGDPDSGAIFSAVILSTTSAVTVLIKEALPDTQLLQQPIVLLFALCKGQKNELVCDWATELGCSSIIFWQAERSVVRLKDERELSAKAARLTKIAQAAAQQSKQSRPPQIHVVRSLSAAAALNAATEISAAAQTLQSNSVGLKLYCSLSPDAAPVHALLSTLNNSVATAIVIGPEGDLSPEEETLLKSSGWLPISLGKSTLRSELAALTAIVAVRG
ncbi:MAG: RsmE family RNA methyltransferase [Proteobacteria bacterium]|nr:RsmE family RNA methyltransferase [Pseudomonadota bacterium]